MKQPKTTQIGLRLDNDLLRRIERYAEVEGIDKMIWIKTALLDAIDELEERIEDAAIEDYIHLRSDDAKLLSILDMKKVPEDMKEARKEVLKNSVSQKVK